MEKIQIFLEEKIQPRMLAFQDNRYLVAIKSGIYGALGAITIGSFFLLLADFPVPGYQTIMSNIFGENWETFFLTPFIWSLNILTLHVFFGIVLSLANHYKMNASNIMTIALASFLILNPISVDQNGALNLDLTYLGPDALLLGILSAILTVELYRFIIERNITVKLPENIPSAVSNSISSLIPGLIIISIFNLIRLFMTYTPFETTLNLVNSLVQLPIMTFSRSLVGIIIIVFLENILWAFGIHGSSIISTAISPVLINLTAENAVANALNINRPNIVNQQFIGIFINLGGSGATIGLVILCLFFSNSKKLKALGKVSIGPSIFMINEPIIFGVPMVLNPLMMIPLVFVPIVMTIITYFVMYLGLVPITNGVILPWTTPPIIGGFLLGGIRGATYQIFQIILSALLYYPFFKIEDTKNVQIELKDEIFE